MPPKIYATFKNEDIANLLPGAEDQLRDPSKVTGETLAGMLNSISPSITRIFEEIDQKLEATKQAAATRPEIIPRVIDELERHTLSIARVIVFLHLIEYHFPEERQKVRGVHSTINYLKFKNDRLNTLTGEFLKQASDLEDEKLHSIYQAFPDFARFREAITAKRTASSLLSDARIPQGKIDAFNLALGKLGLCTDQTISLEERKLVYAQAISEILRFKNLLNTQRGVGDSRIIFSEYNSVPPEFFDRLAAATTRHLPEMFKALSQAWQVLRAKSGKEIDIRYSWEEAKEVVIGAYSGFDPEIGKIARRAFDEKWIHAQDELGKESYTYAGLPSFQLPGAHPFATIAFRETPSDVLTLGHEMGHLISNYLVGTKQSVHLTNVISLHDEQYSHFGENLVAEEMIKRKPAPMENLDLRIAFQLRKINNLVSFIEADWQRELLEQSAARGGKDFSYTELSGSHEKKWQQIMPGTPRRNGNEIITGLDINGSMANLQALSSLVYPISRLTADAMQEAFKNNPDKFRADYRQAMEAGPHRGVITFWDTLLGEGVATQPDFFERQTQKIASEIKTLRNNIDRLPDPRGPRPRGPGPNIPKPPAPPDDHQSRNARRAAERAAKKGR